MSIPIGIDLGTTNTVVAAVRDGRAVALKDEAGRSLLPSVASFHPSGTVLIGEPAKDRQFIDGPNTVFSVKRLIGRCFSSPEVQDAKKRLPFELREGARDTTVVAARGGPYELPEISAFVIRRAKAIAEAALGEPVERAVITVPANFNDLQRASTKVAGKLAGLEVMRILNEPTAAALAYGQAVDRPEQIVIYDLGGGTFDLTLLTLSGNVFEVLGTAGDTALGGDDLDISIADRIANQVLKTHRFDPRTVPEAYGRLRAAAERMKVRLSVEQEVDGHIQELGYEKGGAPLSVRFRMTRGELEHLAQPFVERTLEVCRRALEAADKKVDAFGRVILVGGATRMPLVSQKLAELFKRTPEVRINPDEVVALGASIHAHSLDESANKRKRSRARAQPSENVTASTQPNVPEGVQSGPEMPSLPFVLPRAPDKPGAEAPARPPVPPPRVVAREAPAVPSADLPRNTRALEFDIAPPPHAPETAPDPKPAFVRPPPPPPPPPAPREVTTARHAPPVVAEAGVAVRKAATLLIDVTPLSLCVETAGGFCDVLIPANAVVPCDRTRVFLTARDGQTSVTLRVAQGESRKFSENTCLGEMELTEIAPKPRGAVQIAVTFEIDADGTLNVRAEDVETKRKTQASMRLLGANTNEGDVEKMRTRQQDHAIG